MSATTHPTYENNIERKTVSVGLTSTEFFFGHSAVKIAEYR